MTLVENRAVSSALQRPQALARMVSPEALEEGGIYPELHDMRTISAVVARAVAARAYEAGVATELPRPRDLEAAARAVMYNAAYRPYR
jgi:malate dehydrogenase (oxaloacetate-decarboxylating)(NADP+)